MASVVRMPSVLAGASEAAIASWLVAPGDEVAVGQPLAEIETEKALVEYAAEEAGVVGRLVLAVGDTGEIGDPIAVLVADGETDADIDAVLGTETPAPGQAPVPVPAATAAQANGHEAGAASSGRIFASPLVRKVAGERGIDLAAIDGTGPNGRIVRRDLELYLAEHVKPEPVQAPAPVQASTPVVAGDRLVPHSPMRRAIARRLTESKATTPHFYMVTECVVDELLELRKRINESSSVKISVNDFVVMAVGAAFRDVPEANVTWSDEGLVEHGSVDISIAVATEGGLVTPVLRGVDSKRLSDIARESQDLAGRARERRLRQDELEGGTLSVSNLGMYGTLEFSGIINPPQSGLLAVGAAKQQPVVTGGAVTIATVMRCTLSIDHRALDGALAARWLAAFTTRLEHPLGTIV
jgi:pyruvate dehydrogenase E2 component (dihydrolipoamide acetyltransferase)